MQVPPEQYFVEEHWEFKVQVVVVEDEEELLEVLVVVEAATFLIVMLMPVMLLCDALFAVTVIVQPVSAEMLFPNIFHLNAHPPLIGVNLETVAVWVAPEVPLLMVVQPVPKGEEVSLVIVIGQLPAFSVTPTDSASSGPRFPTVTFRYVLVSSLTFPNATVEGALMFIPVLLIRNVVLVAVA